MKTYRFLCRMRKKATKEKNDALVAARIANENLQISLSNEKKATGDAIENARIAHARQLAAQAITLANEQPDLALLLSLEAIRIDNSPESRSSLFTALGRGTPKLWRYLRGHDTGVWNLASNPAGNRLASADENGTVILWNIGTWMPSCPPLKGHKGPIHSLAFNPKGDLLATIDDTGTLRLWDTETARLLNDLEPELLLSCGLPSALTTGCWLRGRQTGAFHSTTCPHSVPVSLRNALSGNSLGRERRPMLSSSVVTAAYLLPRMIKASYFGIRQPASLFAIPQRDILTPYTVLPLALMEKPLQPVVKT